MLQFLLGRKIILPILAVPLLVLTAAVVFFLRSPLLIVTDSTFLALYSPQRLDQRRNQISRSLFRRVFPVFISESAGPELVAFAVEGVHRSPWVVLFPNRYLEGARFYREMYPNVRVIVSGASVVPDETELAFIRTDTALDLYRAGLCAAFFAGENDLLFFSEGSIRQEYQEALVEGLRNQGFLADPLYVNTFSDHRSYDGIGSVIVAGPAIHFFERNLDIPIILFSWIDPTLSPRTVKLIFDDSPWALAERALRTLPSPGEEILVSSMPLVFMDRIEERSDFRKLQDLIKEKF